MEFDFKKLEEQLPAKVFNNFLNYFTDDLRQRIIEKTKEKEFIIEPLGTDFKEGSMYEEILFTNIVFHKISEDTIEVYIDQNSFTTIM